MVTGSDKVTKKHIAKNLINETYLGRGIFILQKGLDIKYEQNNVLLNISGDWIALNTKEKKYIKPYIKAENLNKWSVTESDYFVIYIGSNELEGQIKNYLTQFAGILLNRSTIIPDNEVIKLEEFEHFTIDDIKDKYSSAGAVQKIMRRKLWWLPLFERQDVPFDSSKIIVNTKYMDNFTFSDFSHYSSGGGSGGQNFIYLRNDKISSIEQFTDKVDFTKFTNAILNSSFIQKYISDGQYNQLSTEKIADLPIVEININDKKQISIYKIILEKIDKNISNYKILQTKQQKFLKRLLGNFELEKISKKFETFWQNDFKTLLVELKKKKIKLSLTEQDEWEEYFETYQKELLELQSKIDTIDKQIDEMVYVLYGLSEDEVAVVEGKS